MRCEELDEVVKGSIWQLRVDTCEHRVEDTHPCLDAKDLACPHFGLDGFFKGVVCLHLAAGPWMADRLLC